MAARKPIVLIGGQPQELPTGDTLAAGVSEVDVIARTNANAGALVKGTPVYSSAAGSMDKAAASAVGTKRVLGLVADTSVAAAASGFVQTDGILTASTAEWDAVAGTTGGLVAGTIYFLSATAGLITATPPATAGQYVCEVGMALSTTELEIDTDRIGYLLA